MARYAYDRLTALDHSFLLLEKPNAYMHVASTQIFEVGPLRTPEGGVDAQAIKEATAALLHKAGVSVAISPRAGSPQAGSPQAGAGPCSQ